MMDKLKLKWKIFAYLLALCALLLIVLWLFQTVFLNEMYKYIRTYEIKNAMEYVEKNINSTDLQSILNEVQATRDIVVSPTQEFTKPDKPWQHDMNGTRREPETITETKVYTLQDGHDLSLTFYAMITPVTATVSTLKVQLWFITAIMIVLSVILAFVIAGRVSRPIEKLNKGAKILAGGDYSATFGGRGFLEIKELSDTLNTAAVELSKVDGLRRDLLANISHDLRTPLALIYSYAEMMHDFPHEITPEQTQVIMDETTRLSTLVNDILDVSKLESGNMELKRSVYNLTQSIGSTVERISALVEKDGYKISYSFDTEVFVNADEVKITQAFYNLLINAITHGGENKVISVNQRVLDDFVTVEVVDSGKGIEEKDLPLIWDRYYKVDKTHKRAIIGTGLGLSIVKKIILLHGGTCGVDSKANIGSTFWFKLPIKSRAQLQ